ncbi:MAG TPA: GNAT family N-acetyltransferase [Anaerolineales bacterium]|nr:GNAT family N-acetyltransferase [Anaerolineales bacterium]
MNILETERLTLRQFELRDAEFILELLNEPSFIRNIADRGVRTVEDARNYLLNAPITSYQKHGFGLFMVELRETGEPIGMCGLIRRDGLQDVDIGYALLPRFWSKGYALEAARAVREYARNRIGLKRLVAIVDPANESSIRVLEKIGLRYEKMIRLSTDDIELKLFGTSLEASPEITSSLDEFCFRPDRVHVGTVFHYLKSNIDGSYPARIFIHIPDHEHLEVLKLEAHGMDAALVKAHMDWTTFSADRFESWILLPDGTRTSQASMSSSFEKKTFTITWKGRNDIVRVQHYPVHVYNFDFISLHHVLPHWQEPEGRVTIGVLQPNFDPDPQSVLNYEGTVDLLYVGPEERDGHVCRRYSIGGPGIRHQAGSIWVNGQNGYVQDMEIPVPDNPAWQDFKFRFVSSEHMNPRQWNDFVTEEVRKLKQT